MKKYCEFVKVCKFTYFTFTLFCRSFLFIKLSCGTVLYYAYFHSCITTILRILFEVPPTQSSNQIPSSCSFSFLMNFSYLSPWFPLRLHASHFLMPSVLYSSFQVEGQVLSLQSLPSAAVVFLSAIVVTYWTFDVVLHEYSFFSYYVFLSTLVMERTVQNVSYDLVIWIHRWKNTRNRWNHSDNVHSKYHLVCIAAWTKTEWKRKIIKEKNNKSKREKKKKKRETERERDRTGKRKRKRKRAR